MHIMTLPPLVLVFAFARKSTNRAGLVGERIED